MLPVIPLIVSVSGGVLAGLAGWYTFLSPDQKAKADRVAANLAMQQYGKAASELTESEGRIVIEATAEEVETV